MKEKSKSLSQRIRGVRLRRSEVRELANILKAGKGSLTVESDMHIFETVDELLASLGSVKSIQFRRGSPTVIVEIGSQDIYVFAVCDDLLSVGLVSRLVEFAKAHRVSVFLRFSWQALLLGFVSGALVFVACGPSARPWRLFLSLTAFFMASLVWIFLERLAPPARIRFRGDGTPVHWRGMAWDLVKLVLGGIIGALLTLFVQRCQVAPPSIPQPPRTAAVSPTADAGTAR
jgi:hypothetical protein